MPRLNIPETPDNRSLVYEVMQVQSVRTLDKISLRKQRGNSHAWKLGTSIIEAKELGLTPDGRMVLSATTNNENVLNAQSLVCR